MSINVLDRIDLKIGAHKTREDGMCAMEAVAWLAGEPHSEFPACASQSVTAAMIELNDMIPDDNIRNAQLKPLLSRIIGTRSTPDVEIRRGFIAADFAVRVFAPSALESIGWSAMAKTLRDLPPIVDRETAVVGHNAAAAASYDAPLYSADYRADAAAYHAAEVRATYYPGYHATAAYDSLSHAVSSAYYASEEVNAHDNATEATLSARYAMLAHASDSAAGARHANSRYFYYTQIVKMIERMIECNR